MVNTLEIAGCPGQHFSCVVIHQRIGFDMRCMIFQHLEYRGGQQHVAVVAQFDHQCAMHGVEVDCVGKHGSEDSRFDAALGDGYVLRRLQIGTKKTRLSRYPVTGSNFSRVARMKNRIVLLSSVCAVLLSCVAPVSAAPGYFRQPSIHGQNIVFVAEGDIWRTGTSGGAAQRLTTHAAAETLPSISPDGTRVAFTARYEGPAEVYVMPIAGGPPTRLTYDGDTALVQGWTPDGRVLYSSTRYSGRPEERLFTINPATRAVKPIPLAEAAEGCYVGGTLFFARRGPLGDNVKDYQGGLAQQIWRFDEGAGKEAVLLTGSHKGTSRPANVRSKPRLLPFRSRWRYECLVNEPHGTGSKAAHTTRNIRHSRRRDFCRWPAHRLSARRRFAGIESRYTGRYPA